MINRPIHSELNLTCWCRPAHEGEPLQHEVACLFYASSVGAPVLQTEIGKILEDVQTLTGWDVPVSVLLYFSEDPGLDESTSEEKKQPQRHQGKPCGNWHWHIWQITFILCAVLKSYPPCNHDTRNSSLFCSNGIFIGKDVSITWVINTDHSSWSHHKRLITVLQLSHNLNNNKFPKVLHTEGFHVKIE